MYGLTKFDLVTDHQALKVIYSRKSKPSARIERWVLRLQPYNYRVCYVSSRKNIADTLSGLTKIVEKLCTECYGCKLVTKHVPPPPVKPTPMHQRPLEDLALDILGPLPSGENLFVLVDYHSRCIEVDLVRATTSKIIIQRLDSQLARYGITKSLRTDNGPNLVSNEIEDYLKEMGVEHQHTTPL